MVELLALALVGLVVGALARLALPGPDPLPLWGTVLLGMAGALVGGAVGVQVVGERGAFLVSVVAATVLLFAYRRVVQKRGVTGPASRRDPRRRVEPADAAADERGRHAAADRR